MDVSLQEFISKRDLYDAAADAIESTLVSRLVSGRASLLLSGGSTPSPVYERLSDRPLNWKNVDVGLVDERWVPNDNAGSNEKLVRETLLQNKASQAHFKPMACEGVSLEQGQPITEAAYQNFSRADVIVLGMGPDGHTASWFPGSLGLAHAMDPSTRDVTAIINAKGCPVAGEYHERITVTLPVIMNAGMVYLLITGLEKRGVLEESVRNLPIHTVLLTRPDIRVFWAP